ncbi:MAG: BatA domain-containing protein [Armatimonadota bacterium]|nr:BatA domain-containing protein [Armatimonadota bacterium]
MTLQNAALLLGAAGIAVPVLIHLFGRPRPRLARFPSLMLLRSAHRQRHSRARLRRLLALILRCLAIVLLALALAIPLSRLPMLSGLGVPLPAAIMLDVSASMSALTGGQRPIDRAVAAAERILSAQAGGRATVALAGARLRIVEEPERELTAGSSTLERGRLSGCLAGLLARSPRQLATVYLLTDCQSTSLGDLPDDLPGPRPHVVVVDSGPVPRANRAVVEADATDAVAIRGRPLRIAARARTWGRSTDDAVPLTLKVAGQPVDSRSVPMTPGEPAVAELTVAPDEPGVTAAEVRLPADHLGADDRRAVALFVREHLRALIIGGKKTTRFVRAALNPFPPGDERAIVELKLVSAAHVAEDLSGFDLAVIADPSGLSDGALARVADEVAKGMGVLLFAGPDADARDLSARILPALGLEGVTVGDAARVETPRAVAEMLTDRPPLAEFAQPGAGDPGAARFSTVRSIEAPGAGATVLARLDDGQPLLIEGAPGKGRALLLASAPDDAWSDLPRQPVFVPLMHALARHLAAGRGACVLDAGPGELLVGELVRPADAVVLERAGSAVQATVSGRRWSATAEEPGVYRVLADGREVAAAAVNIDPAESDPTQVTDAQVRDRLRPLTAEVILSADVPEAVVGRTAIDLSSVVALLAVLLIAVEAVISLAPDGSSTEREARSHD